MYSLQTTVQNLQSNPVNTGPQIDPGVQLDSEFFKELTQFQNNITEFKSGLVIVRQDVNSISNQLSTLQSDYYSMDNR